MPSAGGSRPSRPIENSTRTSAVDDATAHAKSDVAMLTSSRNPAHGTPNAAARSFAGDVLEAGSSPVTSNPMACAAAAPR